MIDVWASPVSPSAFVLADLFGRRRRRVVIHGASGWFGRTALALLLGQNHHFLLIGSARRTISVNGQTCHIFPWTKETVEDFCPDVVLDFAFLARDRLSEVGMSEFVRINSNLVQRMMWLVQLPSVESMVTVSSGAAKNFSETMESSLEDDPYGFLKFEAEKMLTSFSETSNKRIILARVWSVSGGFAGPSPTLAFSSFIRDALKNRRILVNAQSPTFRRYCAVEELLALCLWAIEGSDVMHLESGGDLVEIHRLAELVAEMFPGTSLDYQDSNWQEVPESYYCSDNLSWTEQTTRAKLELLSLRHQIENVARAKGVF